MAQYKNILTSAAKAIVVNFLEAEAKKNANTDASVRLMASLYSLMPGAETEVVEGLKEYIVDLTETITEQEIGVLKAKYPAVVKYCYEYSERNSKGAERYEVGMHVPQTLIDLCIGMAAPKAGSRVYLPYSGVGRFASNLEGCKIEGFEQDIKSWAISQILLHAQEIEADIENGDETVAEDRQYDYIFTFPPMVMGGRGAKSVIDVIHRCITKHLANKGEMYCILPIGFCNSNGGWKEVRNVLRDNGSQYGTLVVSLPPLMTPITNVGLCLLKIMKNNAGAVTLMDATTSEEFYTREKHGRVDRYKLDTQALIGKLRKHNDIHFLRKSDERYIWKGTTDKLSEGTNLLPTRYLVSRVIPSVKAGEKRVRLADVISIVETAKRTDKQGFPIVGMRELSATYLNCDIDVSALERQEVATKVITTDCLLVGFIGGKFKVGRLHGATPETPVALRNEVVPITVTSNDITEDFLLRSITTEMSEVQARALAVGSVLTRLSSQDILRIEIDVPDQGEQDALKGIRNEESIRN